MEERGTKSMERLLMENFMAMGRSHRAVLERLFAKTGVFRSQHQILMCIAAKPDLSQKEVAELYCVSTAAVTVSLKKLEKGGYIERQVDRDDNRYHKLRLTGKGAQVVESSRRIFHDVETAMFDGFSEEEKETLLLSLQRVQRNLETMLQNKNEKE